eukprot:COSAG02_NODE_3985_length_5949_cov_7.533846_5_plen_151_part_00
MSPWGCGGFEKCHRGFVGVSQSVAVGLWGSRKVSPWVVGVSESVTENSKMQKINADCILILCRYFLQESTDIKDQDFQDPRFLSRLKHDSKNQIFEYQFQFRNSSIPVYVRTQDCTPYNVIFLAVHSQIANSVARRQKFFGSTSRRSKLA